MILDPKVALSAAEAEWEVRTLAVAPDNDEVLPTLLLADAARWYVDVVTSGLGLDAAHRLLDELEASVQRADVNLQNTIAAGFLETLPAPNERGRSSVDLLPSSLRHKLDRTRWTDLQSPSGVVTRSSSMVPASGRSASVRA